MLLEKPVLHRMAADAIATLAKEGIVCAPDEILWLQAMAGKALHPAPADESLFLQLPIPCGNVLLWPLSIGARVWFEDYGRPWFAGTGLLEEMAVAFCLAHSREPEVFRKELTSCGRARLKVALWAARLNATRRELNEAVGRCLAGEDSDLIEVEGPKPTAAPAAADYGDCVALLCHFFGESPDYWLWQAGDDECAALLSRIASLLPGQAGKTMDVHSPKFRALAKFKLVVAHIRKAHAEKKVGSGFSDANSRSSGSGAPAASAQAGPPAVAASAKAGQPGGGGRDQVGGDRRPDGLPGAEIKQPEKDGAREIQKPENPLPDITLPGAGNKQ
jgi:hypothetical protein